MKLYDSKGNEVNLIESDIKEIVLNPISSSVKELDMKIRYSLQQRFIYIFGYCKFDETIPIQKLLLFEIPSEIQNAFPKYAFNFGNGTTTDWKNTISVYGTIENNLFNISVFTTKCPLINMRASWIYYF